jgi:hypothetical protein
LDASKKGLISSRSPCVRALARSPACPPARMVARSPARTSYLHAVFDKTKQSLLQEKTSKRRCDDDLEAGPLATQISDNFEPFLIKKSEATVQNDKKLCFKKKHPK